MKRFLFVALMLLITSPLYAAAATFSMTGDYYVEGKWWGNYNLDKYEKATVRYIDQEVNLYPKIQVGDTTLNLRIDLAEVVWGGPEAADRSDYAANVKGLDQFTDGNGNLISNDANINIERAYISHKFNDTYTLDVGLQDGGGWGTVFGNAVVGQYRIKLAQKTTAGTFLYYYEKPANLTLAATAEQGDTEVERNAEEDDTTNFYLGYINKFGPITVKNLVGYSYGSSADRSYDNRGLFAWADTLALNGDLGAISFESEFMYKRFRCDLTVAGTATDAVPRTTDTGNQHWKVYSGYINVWKDLGTMTPGFLAAYGSYDEEAPVAKGVDFGANFNTTPIFGDQLGLGGGKDLYGMTAYKLYVNDIKTGVKPLTLSAFLAYITSNQKSSDAQDAAGIVSYFDGLKGWEAGIGGAYQITDNLVYNAWTSYGKATLSSEYKNYAATLADPDDARNLSHNPAPMYLLAHSLTLSF